MPACQDIDDALRDWPYEPGVISARIVHARDGREVVQLRIEMGVMQMEIDHRPDGRRPGGYETYLDFLLQEEGSKGGEFVLSEEQCDEVDREFVEYYHRRICWLALREFDRAIRDADHTLALMDFVLEHSPSEEWTLSHEQYRPFVLFHRTQAAALASLDKLGAEAAIEEIDRGLAHVRKIFESVDGEEQFEEDEMVHQLLELKEGIRKHYHVGRTLAEQLAEAVAAEQYELAARIRDEMARRRHSPKRR